MCLYMQMVPLSPMSVQLFRVGAVLSYSLRKIVMSAKQAIQSHSDKFFIANIAQSSQQSAGTEFSIGL